jgi:hypothetical protein
MSYVIKRKSDGKFAKGRTVYSAEWVDDLSEARVYPTKGNATTSLRYTFNRLRQYQRTQAMAEDQYEIIEIAIVAKAWMDQADENEKDARFLNHLRAAGVDNWDGYGFAVEAMNEEDEQDAD